MLFLDLRNNSWVSSAATFNPERLLTSSYKTGQVVEHCNQLRGGQGRQKYWQLNMVKWCPRYLPKFGMVVREAFDWRWIVLQDLQFLHQEIGSSFAGFPPLAVEKKQVVMYKLENRLLVYSKAAEGCFSSNSSYLWVWAFAGLKWWVTILCAKILKRWWG